MFSKLQVLLLFFTLQSSYIHGVIHDEATEFAICVDCVRKIQNEILTNMKIQIQGLWKITPKDHNIQYFPILDIICNNMEVIKLYYGYGLQSTHSKEKFLQQAYEFACLLDRLEQHYSVKLRFRTIIYYDKKHINEEYLYDIKTYYHTQAQDFIFNPNNPQEIKTLINNWISANTRGRQPEKENLLPSAVANFHVLALHYTACWNTTNYLDKDVLLFTIGGRDKKRSRRHISIAGIPTLNFDNITKLYVDTFSSKGRIGYYNNPQLGFEAIRIPYKFNEFAMTIMLPYENRDLDMFVNFTPADYLGVLKYIGNNYENIHYVVPVLNLTMASVTETGTSINRDDPTIHCTLVSSQKNIDFLLANNDFKSFIVNRPFGMIIYHEATKFVLWQAWIRDPTSTVYVPRKFSSALREIT